MARNGDLPRLLDSVHPRHRVPDRAELAVGVAVAVVVAASGLRDAIGVLLVRRARLLRDRERVGVHAARRTARWPRALKVIGCIGCVVLVAALPLSAIVVGSPVLAVGLAGRVVVTSGSLAPWRRSSSTARRSSPSGDA